jgi:transcriptional regulator with XRE-family HTH domain
MPSPLIRSRDCMPPGLWQNRRMSSQIADTVAERLQRARERAGYGAANQVAAAFGWPDYAADESGERTLTPVRARLYAHAFHVDLEWLLSGESESASELGSTIDTASVSAMPADELAERIGRLTDAQRAALLDFLRALQEN